MKKIYTFSPSASVVNDECKELIERAQKTLSQKGIEVIYSTHFFGKQEYLAGSIEERVGDIHAGFLQVGAPILLSSQGGDNSNQLLNRLDFSLIKEHYKPLFGMSDVTVLLNAIFLQTGKITYHGLDFVWGLGKNGGEYTYQTLASVLDGTYVPFQHPVDQNRWRVLQSGEGVGTLFGGCLSSLILLLGTRFDPLNYQSDYVLFLEDILEKPQRLSAFFETLRLHKNIQHCKGIILGNFFLCHDDAYSGTIEILAQEAFGDLSIPIVKISEIGHAVENMIMPIGQMIRLAGDTNGVSLSVA